MYRHSKGQTIDSNAGTAAGLFFSENGGNTWSLTTFGNEEEVITALTADGNTVYVGTWRHGIFRSDDAGGNVEADTEQIALSGSR